MKKIIGNLSMLFFGLILICMGGNYASSEENSLLSKVPSSHQLLGKKALKKGNYLRAVEEFKRALVENPEDIEAHSDLALAYLKLRQYPSAIDECKKILKYQPKNGQAYYMLGIIYYEMGEWDEAVSSFQEASRLDPALTLISHFHMGLVHFSAGLEIMAKREFSKVLEMNPPQKMKKKVQRMIDSIEKGKMQSFLLKEADLSYSRGVEKFKVGEYKEAAREFERAATANPREARILYYLGYTYYNLKDYQAALNYFEAAKTLEPKEDRYIFMTGLASFLVGDQRKAEEEFLRTIELDSKYSDLARKYLELIKESRQAKKRWSLIATINREHDTNVTLFASGNQTSGVSDNIFNTILLAQYKLIDTPKISAGVHYFLYQDLYEDLKGYDFQGHFGRIYTTYRIQPFILGLEYGRSFYYLDYDPYQDINKIAPSITLIETKNLLSKLDFSYQWINSKDADYDYLEGRRKTFSISQYLYFLNRKSYLKMSYEFQDEDVADRLGLRSFFLGRQGRRATDPYLPPEEEQGTERFPFFQSYSYKGHKLFGKISIPLFFGINLSFSGEFLMKDYSSDDWYLYHDIRGFDSLGRPNFLRRNGFNIPVVYENRNYVFKKRADTRFDYSILITKNLFKYFDLSFGYRNIENDSNIGTGATTDRNYDREIFSFTLSMRF